MAIAVDTNLQCLDVLINRPIQLSPHHHHHQRHRHQCNHRRRPDSCGLIALIIIHVGDVSNHLLLASDGVQTKLPSRHRVDGGEVRLNATTRVPVMDCLTGRVVWPSSASRSA